MPEPGIAEAVIAKLAVHLGPNVARMSIDAFARKAGVGKRELLTSAHLPALVAEIRPMLNVMIGKGPSDAVVGEIERMSPAR